MPEPARLLELDDLHVRRGETVILDRISWTIRRGENWVIMGPNGGGKTTLLRVLAGYLSPTDGEMTLLGARFGATDWRDVRQKLGIVSSALHASIPPAEPALETVISGRYAQLDFWGEATAADARAARRHLAQLDADHLADRPWLYLSQGERQRVLIARSLMAKPSLLVLDEPCAGLDPVARAQFLKRIDKLGTQARRPGLVLVTHHVEEITPAFSHVILIGHGRVIAAGPRASVLRDDHLSTAFGARVRLRSARGQQFLQVED